ncbi:hypothetical protein BaRGS_00005768 [Batillaria attramentaria]|uniref:Uncharacterized protein n=1 Tax=Batillaria attramentaria TaxID=370345 RepID=A0ABD0LW14_9CAEN
MTDEGGGVSLGGVGDVQGMEVDDSACGNERMGVGEVVSRDVWVLTKGQTGIEQNKTLMPCQLPYRRGREQRSGMGEISFEDLLLLKTTV